MSCLIVIVLLAQFGPNEHIPEKPDYVILSLHGHAKNQKKTIRHFCEKIKNVRFSVHFGPFGPNKNFPTTRLCHFRGFIDLKPHAKNQKI